MDNQSIGNYITVDELAKMLPFKKSNLYKLVSNKQIPFYRVGKLILFSALEIHEWMLSKRVVPQNQNIATRKVTKYVSQTNIDVIIKNAKKEVLGDD